MEHWLLLSDCGAAQKERTWWMCSLLREVCCLSAAAAIIIIIIIIIIITTTNIANVIQITLIQVKARCTEFDSCFGCRLCRSVLDFLGVLTITSNSTKKERKKEK
jgi:hypothetical protein